MLRPSSSGYPRAGRFRRTSLTRRSLLGAAAVAIGAGVADVLHKPGKKHATASRINGAAADGSTVTTPTPSSSTKAISGGTDPTPLTHPTSSTITKPAAGGHNGGATKGKGKQAHNVETGHSRHDQQVALPVPTVRVRTRPIFYVDQLVHNPPKNAIALTIDDGPDPEYTPKVLRLLDKYRMQASFCVVGVHADTYPKLIRDISRAGHVIVNHSYTHVQPFSAQSQQRIVAEITRTQRSLEKAAKVTPELFRSPGGDWSPFVFEAIASYGLTPLDWDVDPLDWEMPGTKAITRAMLAGRPNDIVICHDGGGDRIETVRALRKVLPTWKHRGYVTVPLTVPSSVDVSAPPTAPANSTASSTPTPAATSAIAPSGGTSSSPVTTVQ